MRRLEPADDRFSAVGINIQEKAWMIWNIADLLRVPFKPHEYGLVILLMTVVKRFHDCLLPTHQKVLDTWEKVKKLAVTDGFLRAASGYQFYNTSRFTFDRLLADPENIESNFRDYLNGFSANVRDVFSKLDFDNIIRRLVESNTLYLVIKEFATPKGYLGPDKISAVDCGYIFEDLVRHFSESFGEEAGAHFTSRDIIYLMTDLLLSGEDMSRQENITVYEKTLPTLIQTSETKKSTQMPKGRNTKRHPDTRGSGSRMPFLYAFFIQSGDTPAVQYTPGDMSLVFLRFLWHRIGGERKYQPLHGGQSNVARGLGVSQPQSDATARGQSFHKQNNS